MADTVQLREIASQLRELQLSSPTNTYDVAAWDASARQFSELLASQHPKIRLPIQVMHYLHDADLRAKDPDYLLAQNKVLDGIIAELELGNIPLSTGTTLSLHPHWLLVVALVVLVFLYLVATL